MLGSLSIVSLLALASSAFAAPNGVIEKRAPTVYLAGDSTMAAAKGGAGTLQGELYLVAKRFVPP
jgi:rhamnogalacturonan acetylesterase